MYLFLVREPMYLLLFLDFLVLSFIYKLKKRNTNAVVYVSVDLYINMNIFSPNFYKIVHRFLSIRLSLPSTTNRI
jgi:hypothetical protein